jgi:hypothetical protein
MKNKNSIIFLKYELDEVLGNIKKIKKHKEILNDELKYQIECKKTLQKVVETYQIIDKKGK